MIAAALVEPVAWRIQPKAAPASRDQQRVAPRIAVLLEVQQPERHGRQRECRAPRPGCAPAAAAGTRGRPVPRTAAPSVMPKIASRISEVRSFIISVIGLLLVGVWISRPTRPRTRMAVAKPAGSRSTETACASASSPASARTGGRTAAGRSAAARRTSKP